VTEAKPRERRASTIIAELLAMIPSRSRDRAERLAEELFGRGYAIGREVTLDEHGKPEPEAE
jgi:hypothetical protein